MRRESDKTCSDRLTAIEDHIEIQQILAGAAMSADVASEEYWRNMFTEDAVLDRKAGARDVGRDAILGIIRGKEQHAAIDHGMAHLASLPYITIEGDRATAIGYLLVVVRDEQARAVDLPGKASTLRLSIYHLSVNQWDFVRTEDGWKIANRTVRPLASEDAHNVISRGVMHGLKVAEPHLSAH